MAVTRAARAVIRAVAEEVVTVAAAAMVAAERTIEHGSLQSTITTPNVYDMRVYLVCIPTRMHVLSL